VTQNVRPILIRIVETTWHKVCEADTSRHKIDTK